MDFREFLKKNIVVLDGAMGTVLQAQPEYRGERPEMWSLHSPKVVEDIHYNYLMAGADVIYTNTFGANRRKLPSDYLAVIAQSIACARRAVERAGRGFVAFDMSSLGELMQPYGGLTFDEAYDTFAEVVRLAEGNVDLFVLETLNDLYEMKAGILAVKENSNLPLIVTMSFEKNGRSFSGCPVEAFVDTAQSLGADAVGLNCSLMPSELNDICDRMLRVAEVPVVIKPNAGVPTLINGRTVFSSSREEFCQHMIGFAKKGVRVLGGCCGCDDSYIKLLSDELKSEKVQEIKPKNITSVCSGVKYVEINRAVIVGERINPTGKKLMKQAILEKNFDFFKSQAIEQVDGGAEILDVNMGMPNIDEAEMMVSAIKAVQSATDAPLQIDTSSAEVLAQALRYYNGKPLVNSVNGESSVLEEVLPLVKKYGAVVVGLTLDGAGLPSNCEERVAIAKRIVDKAGEYGIGRENIVIDCLTLTMGAQPEQVNHTLDAIKIVKDRFGVKTTLGVSNISFGLPERQAVNLAFLHKALQAGLDLPIINPNAPQMASTVAAFELFEGTRESVERYVERFSIKEENEEFSLKTCIIKGMVKEANEVLNQLLEKGEGFEIVDKYVIPALNIVGEKYESGVMFLPQLIGASEVAKAVCEKVREHSPRMLIERNCLVLIATVEGDIHDIGKNIVKTVLGNYGYDVIDLGRDVKVERVVEEVLSRRPQVLGLSALMTTTLHNMARTIEAVRKVDTNVKICVGGAVLSESVARDIGADFYTKDPHELIKLLANMF